jgi:predicted site-specific integrase-resolvase
MPGDKWMSVQETMDYLGIARATVDLYAREGKLKRFARGKNTMFLREQVEKLGEPKPKLPRKPNQ